MATYNSSHGAGPGHAHTHTAGGPSHSHGLPVPIAHNMTNGGVAMDVFDQDLNFDESLLDSVNGLAPLQFTPSYDFENFGNTFEDPFSYPARPVYDVPADVHEPFNDESPDHEELDNKLLGFSATFPKARVIDGNGNFAEANLSAELLGMFFVAEDVFGGENAGRPLELTCYRRNLWQCSGQVTLPRHVSQIMDEQGQQLPVFELAASISAVESIEGKQTEIISIPWKSANGDETKSPSAPPNIPLDLSAGQEPDHNRVSLPVSWKRLQFKHATANNGRRKGLQQHYVVQINLLGKVNGELVKIAEIQSGPVIVRGRSPRNFDSRKDVVLSSDKKGERRATGSSTDTPTPVPKTERDEGLPQNVPNYQSRGNVQHSSDWTPPPPSYGQQSPHPAKKMAVSPNPSRPPVPAWSSEGSISSQTHNAGTTAATPRTSSFRRSTPSTIPINLSLSEDERSPNRSTSDPISPHFPKSHLGSQNMQHPIEDEEEEEDLYEYFPLSVDDWMPPVDAIYRPHVVHHTIVPPELKAQQVRSRTKRYFSSD